MAAYDRRKLALDLLPSILALAVARAGSHRCLTLVTDRRALRP
jgi:hypothetical protein